MPEDRWEPLLGIQSWTKKQKRGQGYFSLSALLTCYEMERLRQPLTPSKAEHSQTAGPQQQQ